MKVVLDENTNGGGNNSTVKRLVACIHGITIGVAHNKPRPGSQEYEIELEYDMTDLMFANKTAEKVYSQLDDEGRGIMISK